MSCNCKYQHEKYCIAPNGCVEDEFGLTHEEDIMKKVALKPCPFKHSKRDGKKQKLVVYKSLLFEQQKPFVFCQICGANGPFQKNEYWAIRKWNERRGK
jgi:Restriction alleviation protein Lar